MKMFSSKNVCFLLASIMYLSACSNISTENVVASSQGCSEVYETSFPIVETAANHSEDYEIVNNMGLLQLIDDCETWKHYIRGSYSDSIDGYNTYLIIEDKLYRKLVITESYFHMKDVLERIFNTELIQKDDYIECPFSSYDDLIKHAEKYFSNSYIINDTAFNTILEYDGQLCTLDRDYCFSMGEVDGVKIISQNNNEIVFQIHFKTPENEIEFTYEYSMICEDNNWVLNYEKLI